MRFGSSWKRRGGRVALVCMVAAVGLMAAPNPGESSTAAAFIRFGSELTPDTQPSNGSPPHPCEADQGAPCTRIMMEAFGRPDTGHKAPATGVIKRIRVIAADPGTFTFYLARAKAALEQGKVVKKGPVITVEGQPDPNEPYVIEVFDVNVPVKINDQIAIKSRRTSALRCSSGGSNILEFQPPLVVGDPFEDSSAGDGCWLLIEAVIKTP